MGFLKGLFSGGDTIRGAFEGAGELAKDIREAVTGQSPELLMKAQELEDRVLTAQAEINKIEAASPSWFDRSWRPALAWVCVLGYAFHYLAYPFLILKIPALPDIAIGELYPLLIAMLGLGIYRTTEKIKGVQDKH